MTTSDAQSPAPPTACLAAIEALPAVLLDQPLDYVFADHFRQRCVCGVLKAFAETGKASRIDAEAVIAYLDHDLRLHYRDEDEDLFPAIRKRAHLHDNLEKLLDQLSEDHRQAAPLSEAIIHILATPSAVNPRNFETTERDIMLEYAKSEQRHLSIENGIVLVIARKRLIDADLKSMSQSMKMRRGLPM